MHKSKLLIVDLDDTILDTSKIKGIFFNKISKKTRLLKKDIEKMYNATKNNTGYNNLIQNLLNKIEEKTKIKLEENLFYSEIKKTRLNQKLILAIKGSSAHRILLTTGSANLQNKKIKMLGIKDLFHRTKIITKDKSEFISSRIKDDCLLLGKKRFNKVIIIDDRAKSLKKRLPKKVWLQVFTPLEFICFSKNERTQKAEIIKDSKLKMTKGENKK